MLVAVQDQGQDQGSDQGRRRGVGAGSDFDFMTILTTEDTGHGVGHNNLDNLNLIGRSEGPVS